MNRQKRPAPDYQAPDGPSYGTRPVYGAIAWVVGLKWAKFRKSAARSTNASPPWCPNRTDAGEPPRGWVRARLAAARGRTGPRHAIANAQSPGIPTRERRHVRCPPRDHALPRIRIAAGLRRSAERERMYSLREASPRRWSSSLNSRSVRLTCTVRFRGSCGLRPGRFASRTSWASGPGRSSPPAPPLSPVRVCA